MRLQMNLKSDGRVVIVLLIFAIICYCSCCFLSHLFCLFLFDGNGLPEKIVSFFPGHSKSRLVRLSLQLKREFFTSKQWIASCWEIAVCFVGFFTRILKGLWQVLSNRVGHPCLRYQMMPSSGKFIASSLEKLLFTQRFLHSLPAWFHWGKPEQGCVINELWQAFCLSGREVPAIYF